VGLSNLILLNGAVLRVVHELRPGAADYVIPAILPGAHHQIVSMRPKHELDACSENVFTHFLKYGGGAHPQREVAQSNMSHLFGELSVLAMLPECGESEALLASAHSLQDIGSTARDRPVPPE
jgi:hypothetical protein